MDYYFLNEFNGKKYIILDKESFRIRCKGSTSDIEFEFDYKDIKKLSISRFDKVYLLYIKTSGTEIDFNIDIDDKENIERCKRLYRKVSSALRESSCKDMNCEYFKDSDGKLLSYNIETSVSKLVSYGAIVISGLSLLIIMALNVATN